MIELAAVSYKDPTREVSAEQAQKCEKAAQQMGWSFAQTIRHKNAFLFVTGDQPLDGCFHEDANVSVICQADLYDIAMANDLRPARNPAIVLASLYQRKGDEFVRFLRGTFSVVLFDHIQGCLKAWIDQFGSGRLVLTETTDSVGVASHLALLQQLTGQRGEIDPAAILDYLQYSCIPAPRTIFKDFCKLEPGQMWKGDQPELRHLYWDMHYDEDCPDHRQEEAWVSELYSAIETAVRQSMGLLRPYNSMGCFLSGGTDSSSVAGLVGKISGAPPNTFSIGFDDPRYNEIGYARVAAESFGADHHEYFVTPDDICQLIHKAAQSYDEPFGNSSIIPTYYCARLAAAHGMTHLLAGDGGDELFGGNERYVQDTVFQRYSELPQWLRRTLIEPSIQVGYSLTNLNLLEKAARYVKRANIPLPDRLYSYSFFSDADSANLFLPSFQTGANGHHPLDVVRRYYGAAPSRNYLNRWLYLDVKITIGANDLRKVTRMCQLAGITARYPLLDPDLAELSGKIPAILKVKGNQLRYLFKKAMAPILPQAVINKTKHGFGLPFSIWLGEHQQLRELTLDTLGSSRCRQRGYFQKNLLEHLWQLYLTDHRIFYGDVLWVLLMLEMWHLHQDEAYFSK